MAEIVRVAPLTPRSATRAELLRVHDARYPDVPEQFGTAGGGSLDLDTQVLPGSWSAATLHGSPSTGGRK